MNEYSDEYWTSPDGLRLHYRDYPGRSDRPPVLCLPGLTRNARDFADLAEALRGEWRVLCPEMRGRGDSDYARDAASYTPETCLADLEALFVHAGITRFVAIGTSLGGILTMLLAAVNPARIAGAVLNDIGPVIQQAGLDRIRDYVGRGGSYPTWIHAAWSLREILGDTYPDYRMPDWLALAKRLMALTGNGRVTFDYDMRIAEPMQKPGGEAPDLWPAFLALAGRPLLAIRGELSDILSAATLAEMARRVPDLATVTIRGTGHAPTLSEPESIRAIKRLLDRIAMNG